MIRQSPGRGPVDFIVSYEPTMLVHRPHAGAKRRHELAVDGPTALIGHVAEQVHDPIVSTKLKADDESRRDLTMARYSFLSPSTDHGPAPTMAR
jgi:hypothetical protein